MLAVPVYYLWLIFNSFEDRPARTHDQPVLLGLKLYGAAIVFAAGCAILIRFPKQLHGARMIATGPRVTLTGFLLFAFNIYLDYLFVILHDVNISDDPSTIWWGSSDGSSYSRET